MTAVTTTLTTLGLRSMRRGIALGLPFFLGFGGFIFVFALTVQDGLQASPLRSGLAIAPCAMALLIGSLLTPRVIERLGRARSGGARSPRPRG
jgi:hypothetical protein